MTSRLFRWSPNRLAAYVLVVAAFCCAEISAQVSPGPRPGAAGLSSAGNRIVMVDGSRYTKLSTALADCPVAGCVIFDSMPETFNSNPFDALPPNSFAEVHLMRQTWITNVTLVVPTKSQIYGSGRGDANAVGTVIQAGPSFPYSTPVLEMSRTNPAFAVRIENLTVDCGNIPGAIGIENVNAEEQSSVRHAILLNCPAAGLDIETSGAQNSGPYEDLEVLDDADCTRCSAATVPVVVDRVASFRGIHGATINSDGAMPPDAGARIDSSGTYDDLHFEHTTAGIVVGSRASTSGVVISNIYCSVPNTDCVKFSSGFRNQNLTAVAVASNGTNLIVDELHGRTLSVKAEGGSVGLYAIGNGTPPTLFTTSKTFALTGSLRTTAARLDKVSVPGMTPQGHCSIAPTNSLAAGDSSGTYISAKLRDAITVTHPPRAFRTWDIQCKPD